jgi:methyl-accepting chemotaxis protein
MTTSNSAQVQELSELRSRVEWLDEERRKYMRRLAEIEQKLTAQERKRSEREQRLDDLERELNASKVLLAKMTHIDTTLAQFKDDIVQIVEQYDKRRVAAHDEIERRQRVEQETMARELADIRKELPAIGRVEKSMEQRVAEETRLAHLIGVLQNRFSTQDSRIEEQGREISYAAESEKHNNRQVAELQTAIHEINRRWEPINARVDTAIAAATRLEATFPKQLETIEQLRKTVESWAEQVQLGEYQRNQKLESWRGVLEEQQDIIEALRREWIAVNDTNKETKLALQTMTGFQKHTEDQQRELTEMTRIELNRMLSRWDEFLLENEKRWKNSEMDTEQRWNAANRLTRQLGDQILAIQEVLDQIAQDGDLMWRVQNAQADALKQLPRIWLEEVQKAVNQNPNRRRQPTLVPIPEE